MNIATFTSKKFLVPGVLLVILILLATLPLYGPLTGLSERDLYIPATTFMYIALAVSWTMFSGFSGYLSLATAAFLGVGIYTTAILRGTELGLGLPLSVVIPIGGAISFILALLVGLATLRLKGIYFIVFTFGLVVLIGKLVTFYEIHEVGIRGRNVPPITYESFYYIMLAIAVATVLTAYFLRRSRLGLALQSIGGNEEAAAHMGVNTTMVKVISFAITAFFMGAAGATLANRLIFIDPAATFYIGYSFTPVLMAIFGGLGQIYGPVIGATIFALLEYWLIGRFPIYYGLIFGIMLIIVILYLPTGLAGLVPKLRNRFGGVIPKLLKGGKTEQSANT
jgi:branched-chain amino acid transport system permease protein